MDISDVQRKLTSDYSTFKYCQVSKQPTEKKTRQKQPVTGTWDLVTRGPYVYMVFFALAFMIYGQALQFLLGKLDDDILIIRPLSFLKDLTNIGTAFTRDPFLSDQGIFYRPLQTVSFMIDAQFFFEKGSVFYFTNILTHSTTCCALFYLLTLLGDNRKAAFIFTLPFLASPLFVHAIAWAPSRGDLLSGLAAILTLVFFIRMVTTGNYKYGSFALIAFAAGMFSKETALFIPLIILAYYFFLEKNRKVPFSSVAILFGGFLLVILLFFFLRSHVVRLSPPPAEFGSTPFFHNLRCFPEYLAKFFIPVHLSPMPGFTFLNTFLGMLLFAFLAGIAFLLKPKPYIQIIFGLAWFFIFAVPGVMYSHNFGSAAYDYLEHRAYLPMAGIIILLFYIFNGIPEGRLKNRITAVMVLFSVFLGIYSFVYTANYKSPIEFYFHAVNTNPASAVALFNRGCSRADLEDYTGAIADFESALKLKPDYSSAYLNKGVSLYALNDKQGAVTQYDNAIRYEPGNFQAHVNKARAKYDLGLPEDAIREFDIAIKLYPAYAPCYVSRGIIFLELNDNRAAQKDFTTAIKLDSLNAFAYTSRGKIRFSDHDTTGACADWLKAANLNFSEARELLNKYCK